MKLTRSTGLACASLLAVSSLGLAGTAAAAAPVKPRPRPWVYQHTLDVAKQHAAHKRTHRLLAADGDTGDEDESHNAMESADQYAEARTAPGVVAPGAYSAAWAQLKSLPHAGGPWAHETGLPYDSDDPRYRDIDSNSSGGAGKVAGRITGLAADDAGYVYAGSANGGVYRSSTGGGKWTAISDRLPAASSGDLQLDARGRLWYATGEGNTSASSFVGSGVYVLANPRTGQFQPGARVGGAELESSTINALRFGGDVVWAATSHGVWTHSTTTLTGPWKLEFAPNPDYLPGGAKAGDENAPYKNIANDVAIDPTDPAKVMLAVGWRSGDPTNGFYVRGAAGWERATALGDLPTNAEDVGNVTFARAKDGSRYYAIDESPKLLATDPDTNLKGIFVSKSGSPFGPWTLIADSTKLMASGSALNSDGFHPGVQSWYNQFLQVDPTNHDHVYLGLEEVFETRNGGTSWVVPGPYWNFGFPCWNIDPSKQTGDCFPTTHPDQHSVTVTTFHGKSYVVVGNDGGAYRRPLNGAVDSGGHAKDWQSLSDGTIDTLQYYSVGVGKDPAGGLAVSGGLQDNGQSIKRGGDRVMGSNFGGDGGDTIVDPANGCNVAEEYVYLGIWVTQNCAVNDGSAADDPSKATSYSVAPPDNALGGAGARFIAPLNADPKDINTWVAGGRHVWIQHKGFAIRSGAEWQSLYDLGATHVATAVVAAGNTVYASWCGPCNNQGFTRGIAVGNADGTGWHQLTLPVDGTVPNRYIGGLEVDPANAAHVFMVVNGFSRKWTEGPGAGVGHVFESTDSGATWKDISANLPDVPANWVKLLPSGGLAVATDLGVLYRKRGATDWSVLGWGLPTTASLQVRLGPDSRLYTATHGRGIWSIEAKHL